MKYTFALILGSLFLLQGISALNIILNIRGKQYAFITNNPVTWFGAWKECNKINMRLVRFSSEDESSNVLRTVRNYITILSTSRFWTSGINSKDAGIFWLDQAEFAAYKKWNKGEPGRGSNFCIYLNHNFNFVDTSCDGEFSFICERNLHAD